VIRPVTRTGQPAPGFRVVPETDDTFQCQGDASQVAIDPNVRWCGSSATDTPACWKSAVPGTVLCLRDPLTHTLARIAYQLGFAPVAAPARPDPEALVLDDGTRCLVRDGGAWSRVPGHPSWYGWYSCGGGAAVYGPIAGHGIDRSAALWTVRVVTLHHSGTTATVRTRSVKAAYFVGTA
jgi:hypothetical protein